MVKIAVIGAGSIAWSTTLIRDLCVTPNLWKSTVSLMDINEERLNICYSAARRYASEVKADLEFKKTTDRREAVKDADFVINTAMAGGHQYYERMRQVSEKHGYYRGINSVEWNMVSDYHTIWGYYQFKLMMDIGRDMEELCPEAWLLLLANPVFEATTLLSRETNLKVLGLCHGHLGYKEMAGIMGLDLKETEVESIGLNHVIWMTKFRYKGEDGYPLLDEWIEKKAEDYWKVWMRTQRNPFDLQMSPAAVDMYKRYGLFPIGDSVRGGTWRYHWNLETKKKWFGPTGGADSEKGWAIYLEWQRRGIENLAKRISDQSTPLTKVLPPRRSEESIVPIMESISRDIRGSYQVNILNKGMVRGIPDDVAVEVPIEIDGKGAHRTYTGELPKRVMKHVMNLRITRMEWALEAFLEGGRDLLFEWLIVDPRTKSNEQIEETINDILSLPENIDMAKHFK